MINCILSQSEQYKYRSLHYIRVASLHKQGGTPNADYHRRPTAEGRTKQKVVFLILILCTGILSSPVERIRANFSNQNSFVQRNSSLKTAEATRCYMLVDAREIAEELSIPAAFQSVSTETLEKQEKTIFCMKQKISLFKT